VSSTADPVEEEVPPERRQRYSWASSVADPHRPPPVPYDSGAGAQSSPFFSSIEMDGCWDGVAKNMLGAPEGCRTFFKRKVAQGCWECRESH